MRATRKSTTRVAAFAMTLTVASLFGTGVAAAIPGHTSCRVFGATSASEARDQTLAGEVLAFTPRHVDDLVALVQAGGTLDGEIVPALCQPK